MLGQVGASHYTLVSVAVLKCLFINSKDYNLAISELDYMVISFVINDIVGFKQILHCLFFYWFIRLKISSTDSST